MRNHNMLLIVYFAGLAVFVGGLSTMGIKPDMSTIITGMVFVAAFFGLVWLIAKVIRRKMGNHGLSKGQWFAKAMGVSPDIIDAMPPAASPMTQALVLYDDEGEEDLPDTIIEPNGLHFADTFQPGVESVLGTTTLITGIRRSGKSNGMAVIAEELARYLLPMLICDTEDEYAGLANPRYMPHAVLAGSTEVMRANTSAKRIAIDEQGAYEFGKSIMDGSLQVVLNLKSFLDDEQAAQVMHQIIEGMNAWEESRANKDRVPCMVMLDEASKWLPQNLSQSYVSKETLSLMQKTFFGTLVRRGGKRGFGVVLAAQRIVELDKQALQSVWKLLFKQTEQIDVARYAQEGIPAEATRSLAQGECFVFCPQALGFRMRMRARTSPHLAHTPGLEQLRRHHQHMVSTDTIAARSFVTGLLDQEDEHETQDPLPVPIQSIHHPRGLSQKQIQVIDLFNEGKRTHREVAAAMSISESEAYRLLVQLDTAGYIQREKRVRV